MSSLLADPQASNGVLRERQAPIGCRCGQFHFWQPPAKAGSKACRGLFRVGESLARDVKAMDALNVVVHLIQAPESLAFVLEAAGSVTLERCGAILDERAATPE